MLIILDRDGVINEESVDYIKHPDEWKAIPGSLEKITEIFSAGHQIIIATNQSGIARGLFTIETLEAIHKKLKHELELLGGKIDDIFFCPHHPQDNCFCRKPKPGMLIKIAEKHQIKLEESFFVGDSLSDIEAAQAAGAKPVLVKTGRGKETFERLSNTEDILIFESLAEAKFQTF